MNSFLQKQFEHYQKIVRNFESNNQMTIPLCAAEPIVSRFSKYPLSSSFSDRYIKSGIRTFDVEDQFIGSEYIYPLYEMVLQLCRTLYSSDLADPRPLSGMNAAISSLMSLTEQGDSVLYLHPENGGHASFIEVLRRLGLKATEVPFDVEKSEYDVAKLNKLIESGEFKCMLIAPSDIIRCPPFKELSSFPGFHILYDCTQSFGFLASGDHLNPLKFREDVVLLGGTHKTLAGPTTGLVMAKDGELADSLESKISPYFVRNPQPHHVAALIFTLLEFQEFGEEFMKNTLINANYLGKCLQNIGFDVVKPASLIAGQLTETHQVFVSLSKEQTETLDKAARRLNISLDTRRRMLYRGYGVRLGSQAITRLGWDKTMIQELALILGDLANGRSPDEMNSRLDQLRGKNDCLYSVTNINEHEFQ